MRPLGKRAEESRGSNPYQPTFLGTSKSVEYGLGYTNVSCDTMIYHRPVRQHTSWCVSSNVLLLDIAGPASMRVGENS